jgi:hypothetical protein
MTEEQRKATDDRYLRWTKDKNNAAKQKQNAASVVRARQWTKDHPEEAKERSRKAREARKARREADPEYAAKQKALKARHRKAARSKPSYKTKRRADDLKPKGWTVELYNKALEEQSNSCAICKAPFIRTPAADHKHTQPPVPRGLLCSTCNTGIGLLRDSYEICEAAAAYLRHYVQ